MSGARLGAPMMGCSLHATVAEDGPRGEVPVTIMSFDAAPDLVALQSLPSVLDAPVETAEVETTAPGFAELGVPHQLVRALARAEITAPFPIQTATIPDALAGQDVLGRRQTGAGK